MEQGKTEKGIIEACIRERRPLPQAIANAPVLTLGLEFYYTAFLDLTTDRAFGYGEGPIPWSSVERYCDRYGVQGEDREDMHHHMRAMDQAYLEHRGKQSKVESPPPASKVPAKVRKGTRG